MKKLLPVIFMASLILGAVTAFPGWAQGPWSNGQDAVFVLGQPNFTSNSSGLTSTTLELPRDVAIDRIHGKLYVLDSANHRVLRYNYPVTQNQPAAELVFGQPDLTSSTPGTTRNTLYQPRGLTIDSEGRLWVSENVNNRIVWFNNAYALAVNQPDADGVLGQPDFTTSGCLAAQNRICFPYDLTVSADGTLFVADGNINSGQGNNRVLRFDHAANKTNGADADGVLGQPNFTSTAGALSQSGMNNPRGVALFGSTLFVAERNNRRVLRFDNAAGKADGADADGVLGQPGFTSNTSSISQTGMDFPGRLAVDESGRLYVSDANVADRVLIFNKASEKGNGGPADFVLGQPDFISHGSATAQNRLSLDSAGGGLAVDSFNNVLFVSDDDNNRIMVFKATAPTILLNPDKLLFTTTVGKSPADKTIAISNGGDGELAWTAQVEAGNPSWLSVTPGSGTGNSSVSVSVNSAGLGLGIYSKTITVSDVGAMNNPQTVAVTLEVKATAPTILLNPDNLLFTTTVGKSPADKTIAISNGGIGELAWTAQVEAGNPSWLSVTPGSGTGNSSVSVSVNSAGLGLGIYSKTITVSDVGAMNNPQTVAVTLEVKAGLLYLPLLLKN